MIQLSIGLVVYYLKRKSLRFEMIQTNLSKEKIKEAITKTSTDLNWYLEEIGDQYAKLIKFQEGFKGGYDVTMLIKDYEILINIRLESASHLIDKRSKKKIIEI